MANWHQQRRPYVKLYHETEWTVVEDPPNDTRTLMCFTTQEEAQVYLDRVKLLRPDVPAYILKPAH